LIYIIYKKEVDFTINWDVVKFLDSSHNFLDNENPCQGEFGLKRSCLDHFKTNLWVPVGFIGILEKFLVLFIALRAVPFLVHRIECHVSI